MFGSSNPFTAFYRLFNFVAPSLTANTAVLGTKVGQPFISNVAATTAILNLTGAAANNANIQFIARDALGNIETNPVLVSMSGATGTITIASIGVAGGVVTTKITTALGQTVTVIPNATTGLVSLIATTSAVESKSVTIQNRHVIATGDITIV